MPLTDDMHLISVDDHLVEPPSLWGFPQIVLNAVAGKDPKDCGAEPIRHKDMISGYYGLTR